MVKVTVKDDQRSSPPSSLRPDPANVRTGADTRGPAWEAFLASIRSDGIIQPIIVRPDGLIVAGHRRHAAAMELGLEEVPILVRDVADEELGAVRLIENLHRQDLDPIDESDAFQALLDRGVTPEDIALRASCSVSTVHRRLQLQTLPKKVKELLRAGEISTVLGVALARIPSKKARSEAIKFVTTPPPWSNEKPSERECLRVIQQQFMTDLERAPFNIEDATILEGVPACVACPKNSAFNATLFPDIEDGASCSDPACFGKKKAANVIRAIKEAKERGQTVIEADDDAAHARIVKWFNWNGQDLSPSSPWIKANTVPAGQPDNGRKQIRTLIDEPVVTIVHPDLGVAMEVIDEKKAARKLKETYDWAKAAAKTASGLGFGNVTLPEGHKAAQQKAKDEKKAQLLTLRFIIDRINVETGPTLRDKTLDLLVVGLLREAMRDEEARLMVKLMKITVEENQSPMAAVMRWIEHRKDQRLLRVATCFMAVARFHRAMYTEPEGKRLIHELLEGLNVDHVECKALAEADVEIDRKQRSAKKTSKKTAKKASKKKTSKRSTKKTSKKTTAKKES